MAYEATNGDAVMDMVGEAWADESSTKARQAQTFELGRDMAVPFNRLVLSQNNVRKSRTDEGIPELAALLLSQGQLQRLSITEAGGGMYAVEAGGRRWQAFGYLVEQGLIGKDHPVECKLYDSSRASKISLAENSGRMGMHPADQFEAFARLIAEGLTVAQVASRFGVTELTVERRMKLASLAPQFIEMFRSGEATMDQLQVLCLTDDHDKQIAAWESLPEYRRSVYMLKQALINDEVEGSDQIARFVGVDSYVAAAGAVRRDLFSGGAEDCWLETS